MVDREMIKTCSLEGFNYMRRLGRCKEVQMFTHFVRLYRALDFIVKGIRLFKDKDKIVLADIGAGYCELPRLCHSKGLMKLQYHCLEFDRKKLKDVANMKFGKFDIRLKQVDLSKGKIPIEDGAVDIVICQEFAEHIPRDSWINLLKDMNRVCHKGSVAFFLTPNVKNGGVINAYHIHEYTADTFTRTLVAAGFKPDKSYGFVPKDNISVIDKEEHNNPVYKSMREVIYVPILKPMLSHLPLEDCKEQIHHCTKVCNYSREIMEAIDFSENDRLMEERHEERCRRSRTK
jgi:SAM-dependent methyltransferase